MLAFLYLAGSIVFGSCLSRRAFGHAAEPLGLVAGGVVLGWMTAGAATYALARLQGGLSSGTVVMATVLLWTAVVLLLIKGRGETRLRPSGRRFERSDVAGVATVLAIFGPIIWRLFSSHTLAPGAGGAYSGGSSWYDHSLHAALASSFAYGANFPPSYPPLSGEPLLYPFLPDFHAAAIVAAGGSMRTGFLATALPLAFALLVIFYGFARRIGGSAVAATLACGLFLLNGGFGFLYLPGDWRASGRPLAEFWHALVVNYANDWDRGIHWVNIVSDILLAQRAAVYGLPAAMLVLTLFADQWKSATERREPPRPDWKPLCAAGIVTGALPYFHTHSYIAVGFVSGCLFLLRPRREWLAFWIPALLLALPQVVALTRHAAGDAIIRLQPGWMGSGAPSLVGYLLLNLGLPLILAVPAWLTAPREWRLFYVAFAALLIAAFIVVVSPNVFDNGKFFYFWHAVNSVLIARWLVSIATAPRMRYVGAPAAALLALACVASGITAVQAEAHTSRLLYSHADFDAARFVREHTRPDALFLTAPTFNHPVLSLAGRSIVRGPTDWLWAHGYDFHGRAADVTRMYAGDNDAAQLLQQYAVQYVYVGPAERTELHANQSFFEARYDAVYRTPDVAIFAVGDARQAGARWHRPPAAELASRVERDPDSLIDHFNVIGWRVFRLLQTVHSRVPTRNEYLDAMREAGRGLSVGTPGWQQTLDENMRALGRQVGGQDPSRVEALIGQASGPFDTRDYAEAWVLVHYFGFLGRNAADPPDHDLAGYRFWVDIVTRTSDYRSVTRAFMSSDEYKRRGQ